MSENPHRAGLEVVPTRLHHDYLRAFVEAVTCERSVAFHGAEGVIGRIREVFTISREIIEQRKGE